jgi:hypothetical protein
MELTKKELQTLKQSIQAKSELKGLELEWSTAWQTLQACDDDSESKALQKHCNQVMCKIILLKQEIYGL